MVQGVQIYIMQYLRAHTHTHTHTHPTVGSMCAAAAIAPGESTPLRHDAVNLAPQVLSRAGERGARERGDGKEEAGAREKSG